MPVFEHWKPFSYLNVGPQSEEGFIGDMSTGRFSYLIHVKDSIESRSAIVKVSGENFSLLETDRPIPAEGPWGHIYYNTYVQADRNAQKAWLLGVDDDRRVYLACIDYGGDAGSAATVSMYYTDPLEGVGMFPTNRLLPDGRIVIAGGCNDSNYEPLSAVYLFSLDPAAKKAGISPLILAALIFLLVAIVILIIVKISSGAARRAPEVAQPSLVDRIESLMKDRQFFRRPNLRLADIASELSTNTTYVSACINSETGLSFPDYVAGYRVRYAQNLLKNYPDMPLPQVASESGFSNEKSFLRTFKVQTGTTPSEWKVSVGG